MLWPNLTNLKRKECALQWLLETKKINLRRFRKNNKSTLRNYRILLQGLKKDSKRNKLISLLTIHHLSQNVIIQISKGMDLIIMLANTNTNKSVNLTMMT